MNDLIRLTSNVDSKSASSPLQGKTELPGIDRLAQGFVNAFVAIGADQIDEQSEGDVVFDSDHSQSLEPGPNMPAVPVKNPNDMATLRDLDTELQSKQWTEPLDSAVEKLPANIGAHDDQAHVVPPLPSAQMEASLRTDAKGQRKPAVKLNLLSAKTPPLAFGEYDRPVARPDDIVRKAKVVRFADAATPKDKMTVLNADLASFAANSAIQKWV